METAPLASTKPLSWPRAKVGFSTTACTSTLVPLPDTVSGTVVVPFGAFDQSTHTAARTCLVTVPDRGATFTYGAPDVMVYANGAVPRLKTSMYCPGWLWNGLNVGSTAGPDSAGHHLSEPSIATPMSAAAGTSIRRTAGKITSGRATLFSSGCCHGAFGPYRATSP